MKFKFLLFLLTTFMFFTQCTVTKQLTQTETAKLQAFIDSMRLEIEAPGLSVAIVQDGSTQSFTSGMSDQENNVEMDANHVLMNGSSLKVLK